MQRRIYLIILALYVVLLVGSVSYAAIRYGLVDQSIVVRHRLDSGYELDNSNQIGLGVFSPEAQETEFQSVVDFEKLIEHKLEYQLFFYSWGDDIDFPSDIFTYTKALEITPIITWEPWTRDFENPDQVQAEYSLTSIASGKHDEYIATWAKRARQTDHHMIIRFAHEATTYPGTKIWYPWQGEPEQYKQAFQRVVTIFRNNGADNVEFMWSPIVYHESGDPLEYYPGDEYVDNIGLTVVNLGDIVGKNGQQYVWLECDYLFPQQYDPVKNLGKPIIISEMLSNDVGGSKADWYTRCLDMVANQSDIIGLLSVQIDEDYTWSHNKVDWRVNSSEEALEAFKNAAKHGFK